MAALLEEDVLVGMFAELAETVAVPAGGAAAALAAIRAGQADATGAAGVPGVSRLEALRERELRKKRVGTLVGVAAAALIVLGVVAVHGGTTSSSDKSAAVSAGPADGLAASAPSTGPQSLNRGAVTSGSGAATSGTAAGADNAPAEALPSAAATPALIPAAGSAAAQGATTTTAGSATSSGAASAPSVDADRVIRTGDINLQVPAGNVTATVPKLEGAASGLGGFLEDSQTQQADPKTGGVPSASVTLRVPAAKFEALLAKVQALGVVVTSTTNGKDVTAQYVDLDARLKALMTSRETYLVILSKAQTVNDTLAVQQRLDDLQQQIEQLQGQQNELAAQSDLGTLTVEVSEPAPTLRKVFPAARPKARSGLSAAWHTAGDRFRRGAEAVIASLGAIALVAIAGLVLFVGYRFGRRYYLRRTV